MLRIVLLISLIIPSFTVLSSDCGRLIDKMENVGELKEILHCLDNKTVNSTTAKPQPFQKGNIKAKLISAGYQYEVEYCSRTNNQLACSVVITNKNKSIYSPDYREFGIYTADTNFFDEYGNEYAATKGQMGKVTVESNGPSNRKNFKDGYLEKYMPLGVPMRLTITFTGVAHTTTTVMALNIRFSYRDGKNLASKYVTLENIGIN